MARKTITAAALMLLTTTAAFSAHTFGLEEALQKGLIKAKFTGLGGSSEECVTIEVSNQGPNDLRLMIPAGTLLHPDEEYMQDLLIIQDAEILVERHDSDQVPLFGFCTEAFDSTPTRGMNFSYQPKAEEHLFQLAVHLNKHPTDPSLAQEAIWAVAGDLELAGIYLDGESERELLTYCADLLGEEIPFYHVDHGEVLDRPLENTVMEVSGDLAYRLDRSASSSLYLYGPDGTLFCTYYEGRELSPASYTQNFSLTGNGLPRGDYRFVLQLDGEDFREVVITV